MPLPKSRDARLFYRSAGRRLDDAGVLLQADHNTGAVYLAGYGVECILKALIMEAATPGQRVELWKAFRGSLAHDFQWLKRKYMETSGQTFPPDVNRQFTLVRDWAVDLRYTPKDLDAQAASEFLRAVDAIMKWSDGRL